MKKLYQQIVPIEKRTKRQCCGHAGGSQPFRCGLTICALVCVAAMTLLAFARTFHMPCSEKLQYAEKLVLQFPAESYFNAVRNTRGAEKGMKKLIRPKSIFGRKYFV